MKDTNNQGKSFQERLAEAEERRKNETSADIIAEIRALSNPISDGIIAINGRRIADRLEAALSRELSKNVSKNGADFGQLGDAAKLHEALKHIKDRLPHMLQYMRVHWEDASAGGYFDELMLVINAALSAPPRNCDVGTGQEQDERFHRFCVKHHTGSCAGCHNPVGDYTVANGVRECALVWAQMPYEEGGAK